MPKSRPESRAFFMAWFGGLASGLFRPAHRPLEQSGSALAHADCCEHQTEQVNATKAQTGDSSRCAIFHFPSPLSLVKQTESHSFRGHQLKSCIPVEKPNGSVCLTHTLPIQTANHKSSPAAHSAGRTNLPLQRQQRQRRPAQRSFDGSAFGRREASALRRSRSPVHCHWNS